MLTISASLFASLAANKSPVVPYSRDIADQRRKYGETMLRKKDEHLAAQRVYEEETEAKIAGARQRREEERVRLETLEVNIITRPDMRRPDGTVPDSENV